MFERSEGIKQKIKKKKKPSKIQTTISGDYERERGVGEGRRR